MIGNGRTALADTLDILTAELEMLIDRHFAAHRELIVSNDEGANWTAAIGDDVLYRSPDGRATLRFARAFAAKTPGVDVVVMDVDGIDDICDVTELVPNEMRKPWFTLRDPGHSVRVPDNVVAIR